jgi:hypothetical protein
MRDVLWATVLMAVLVLPASAAPPGVAPHCPGNPEAVIGQACPCNTFRNHGEYVNCVKQQARELEKSGCDKTEVSQVQRCASMAICGQAGVVCCDARGRARVMAADRCTAKGGRVVAGATTICNVSCEAAVPPLGAPGGVAHPHAGHRPRHLPPGATP